MALVKSSEGRNQSLLSPFNDLIESFFSDSYISDRVTSKVPAVNIFETENEYHIELGAPGLKKEDFKVNLDKNMLNISVEKKQETSDENKRYNRREYSYTSFVRSFSLPDSADDGRIDAQYHDGVLDIKVAKKEEAKLATRQIEIR